jgi:hypothetical protein
MSGIPVFARAVLDWIDPPDPPPELEILISRIRAAHRQEVDSYRARIQALEMQLARKRRGQRP